MFTLSVVYMTADAMPSIATNIPPRISSIFSGGNGRLGDAAQSGSVDANGDVVVHTGDVPIPNSIFSWNRAATDSQAIHRATVHTVVLVGKMKKRR